MRVPCVLSFELLEHGAEGLDGALGGDDECAVAAVGGGSLRGGLEAAGDDDGLEGGGVGVVVVEDGDEDWEEGGGRGGRGGEEGVGCEVGFVGVFLEGFCFQEEEGDRGGHFAVRGGGIGGGPGG